ncbi:MAG: CbiX/SirB N-terminal domain-containing protein [Pseudomonadota bacterium]
MSTMPVETAQPGPVTTPPAVILFAHGSRDPLWRLPIEAVASEILRRDPAARATCAYLELCEPNLSRAAAIMVASGASRIRVFPLFLGVGKHAREDLPLLMDEIRAAHPGVDIELMPTAGEFAALTCLLADLACA